MTENVDAISAIRTRIVTELLESLAEPRKIMLDSNKDLKRRERWTQLHNSTSQILNTVLRDLQERGDSERLKNTGDNKTTDKDHRIVTAKPPGFEGFIRRVRKSPALAGVAKTGQRRENSTLPESG